MFAASSRKHRLTHSVLARLAPDGRVLAVETTPSVIRSAARLNYDQVQAFFDGDPGDSIPEDVRRTLTAMRELAAIRRAGRMAQGAIDLALPEVRCILDTQGEPIAFRCAGATEAYHLIEEFMLVANTAVARRLHRSRRPALYRVHDAPDETQWKQLRSDLRALDIHARPRTRDDLNAIARAALNSPMQYSIHLAILRNLKRALYTAAPREHFGLAFGLYTHFTSPIRRYPDLIVHRILQALEAGAPTPYTTDELATIAAHCSETEEEADRAEEESVALKRLAWYKHLLAERRPGPFDALVVALQPKGLVLELSDTLQRGLLPFSALTDDYYEINPEHNRAVGRRHKRAWTIGQRLSVCLARVDIARRLVDFYPAPDAEGVRGRDKRK